MAVTIYLPILLLAFILIFTFIYILSAFLPPNNHTNHGPKRPPGPKALPIIGNMHLLGTLPHRKLQSLAKIHGPIMSIRLGQVPAIVVSTPEAAQLFLKTHDPFFATRPKIQATHYIFNNDMVFSEYGSHWRHMKKLCTLHLLSASKVDHFGAMRRQEVCRMVKWVEEKARNGEVVNVSVKVRGVLEDMICKMIFGRSESDQFDLKGILKDVVTLTGAFNLADYVPCLAPFDLQGLTRRLKKTGKAIDEVLEKIIKEHEEESSTLAKNANNNRDLIHILLSLMHQSSSSSLDNNELLQQNHGNINISRDNIKALALDLLVASYETSTVSIEWALSELLRNPRVMKNLQHELENVVGMDRMVEEPDLPKLKYLNMIIMEILRLYPGGIFIPRESTKDVVVDGYFIQKKSRVMVNLWAIGRDPKTWSENMNADVFYPERFLKDDVDLDVLLQGNDFRVIAFGSGRRKCPGMQMGMSMIRLVLAQLVHCFDWELPYGISPCELDMTETFGLSMPRSKYLLAVPTQRIHTLNF